MPYTVTPDRLDATFVPSVGSVTDSFTISANESQNGDVTPPTAPSNLVATSVGGDQVDLSWTQSTDAVGVDHYTVIRDGVAVGTTSGTSYFDTSLTPGKTYSYVVRASDLAGTSRRHPTPRPRQRRPGASSRSPPTADATIRAGAPTTNYGTSSSLSVDSSPSEHRMMKFAVTGIGTRTVTSAKLRLFNVGASDTGRDLRHLERELDRDRRDVGRRSPPPSPTRRILRRGSAPTRGRGGPLESRSG